MTVTVEFTPPPDVVVAADISTITVNVIDEKKFEKKKNKQNFHKLLRKFNLNRFEKNPPKVGIYAALSTSIRFSISPN